MADLGEEFNASDAKYDNVLPKGDYDVVIVGTDVKQTKDGSGSYLEIDLQVCSGEFTNKRLKGRITRKNASQQAKEIGDQQLAALMRATGVLKLSDSAALHGKTLTVSVKPKDGFNNVSGYKPRRSNAAQPQVYTPPVNATAVNW